MKTTIFKGRYGWEAETGTPTDANGNTWRITTMKRSNGRVTCEAQECQDQGDGMVSYVMFGSRRKLLAERVCKATEKTVAEIHAEGLEAFKAFYTEEQASAPAYVIEVGQVVFTSGHENEQRRAVYEIVRPGRYKTVYLDGSGTRTDKYLTEYGTRQGIGVYYRQGDKIGALEVQELVKQAKAAEAAARQAEEAERIRMEEDRRRKIVEGAKVISAIPEGVTGVIVGELHKDTSDPMSDYYEHTTERVVYLTWTYHNRDLFPELRKAAGRCEFTASLESEGPEVEHREKYSMGSGYYLKDGYSNSSGWAVKKAGMPDLETLQIAAAEGRFFCGMPEEAPDLEPVEVTAGQVQIIDYSAKAIAVVGDTKPIKDLLRSLGGKFNFRLTCGPGWIFPKTRQQAVSEALNKSAQRREEIRQGKQVGIDAGLVQAQEEAYFDNFCYANSI